MRNREWIQRHGTETIPVSTQPRDWWMAPASVPRSATLTSACTIRCGTMKLPSATVIAGLFPWEERLLLQPVNQLFPGKSALLENPEQRSFRKVVLERDNGSVGPVLEADVAALLSNYLKTFFLADVVQEPSHPRGRSWRRTFPWLESHCAPSPLLHSQRGEISYTLLGTLRGSVGRGYFVAGEGIRVEHVESRNWRTNPRRGTPGSPALLREEPGRRHLGICGPEPASSQRGDSGGCARGCADARSVSVRMDATALWQGRPPNGCDGGRPLPSDRSPGPKIPPACGRHHPKTAPGRRTR